MAETMEEILDFEAETEQAGKARSFGNEITEEFERTANDFEDDLEFIKPDGVSRKSDRAVFFAGDLMDPRLRRTRPDFVTGGEYFGTDFPALAMSKFALFRARITPLKLAARALPADEPIKNNEIEAFDGEIRATGGIGRVKFVKSFPGDQLETIVYGARDGEGKGYVEITALEGKDYKLDSTKALYNKLQIMIFPEWMEIMRGEKHLPPTLRGLQELIETAKAKYSDDEIVTSVCADMLESCRQFRSWGLIYLQREALRVRQGVHPNGGYVHSYSQVAELLLVQLEIKRESINDLADVASNGNNNETLAEMMKVFGKMAETITASQEAITKSLAQSATGSAQTIENGQTGETPKPPAKPANNRQAK